MDLLGVPSIKSLNLIKQKGESFRLVDKVGTKWKSIGYRLDISDDVLSGWHGDLRDTKQLWNKVMNHWLTTGGTPDYPLTWEGLYELLKDVECTEITKQLEEFVSSKNK